MKWIDYRDKLGIGFNDEEKSQYFITLIFNMLRDIEQLMYQQFTVDEYRSFCIMTGTRFEDSSLFGGNYRNLLSVLEYHSENLLEFISYYMAFVNCLKEEDYYEIKKEDFKNVICNLLKQSNIPFDIICEDNEYFVFPKGAKELDDALVSEPLEWLSDYPIARKTYVIALKQYSEGVYIRDVADNLRKTLEAFLQEFLGNSRNLETNKNEICKYLGEQGVDAGVSGLFQPLINAYKNINDRIAKHNDAVDEKLLEFLLYQTGVLIRMVLSVKLSEDS